VPRVGFGSPAFTQGRRGVETLMDALTAAQLVKAADLDAVREVLEAAKDVIRSDKKCRT